MQPIEFIKKNIITELKKQGAMPGTAINAADYAAAQYKTIAHLGKDPYGELLRLAGAHAMKYQTDFRYVQPKPTVYKRLKS